VLLLDTQLDQNLPEDRTITDRLYGGDKRLRLRQEAVLGIGGERMLRALGFEIETYHLNEGHAALLTAALLRRHRRNADLAGEGPRTMTPTRCESAASSPPTPLSRPDRIASPGMRWSKS
jgi:glycogen phosphorylase